VVYLSKSTFANPAIIDARFSRVTIQKNGEKRNLIGNVLLKNIIEWVKALRPKTPSSQKRKLNKND
jgi:hypothetical protein